MKRWPVLIGWSLVGLALTAAPSDAEPAAEAWSPDVWHESRAVLEQVDSIDGSAAVALRFADRADPDAAIRRVDAHDGGRYTVEVWLPDVSTAGVHFGPTADAWPDGPPRIDARPDGATLTVTLRPTGPTALERVDGGWRLGQPLSRSAPDGPSSGPWVDTPDAGAVLAEVHLAMADARDGRGPAALGRLLDLLDRPAPTGLRAAIHLAIARLAVRERLLLVALGAASRAARRAPDARIRSRALAILLDIEGRIPTALSLIAPDIAPTLVEGPMFDDADAVFAIARALLRVDEPVRAAELARRVHHRVGFRPRARFIAHAAARLLDERAAAEGHLEAMLRDNPEETLRADAFIASARLAYETGDRETAEASWEAAATIAASNGDVARLDAIDVVRGWWSLRDGRPAVALDGLIPLDLDRHGKARALLAATAYFALCHPQRASVIASRLIEMHPRLTQVEQQRRQEAATLARPRFEAVRAGLEERLQEHDDRIMSQLVYAPDAFYTRRALRLRASADMLAGHEAYDRMDPALAREMPPPESPSPAWQGSLWADSASIVDRCARPHVAPPFGADQPSTP